MIADSSVAKATLHATFLTERIMGVGLYLTGTYRDEVGQSSDDWLEEVASWLEAHEEEPLMLCRFGENSSEQPTLFVQVHPCAEEIEFCTSEPSRCVVSAKTSTVGPGYHIFLCELLHAFGTHFNVVWDEPDDDGDAGDETGYFFTRDADAVRREMLRWLSALSRVVIDNCNDTSDAGIRMVSMPLDYSYPDQQGILTPMGPRAPEWFEQMIDAPERGLDFFAWWPEGVGSAFFLGRAVCRLWQEVRWRTPITEDEGEALMEIHLDLERAFHLDAQANIPWREWSELIGYLNGYFGYVEFQHEENLEAEILRRAEATDGNAPAIGYRRGPVQVTLTGGWSITVPGVFAEQWEENGETWSAWNAGRTVWFTSWSVCGENDEKLPASDILDSRPWPDGGEIFEHQDGAMLGRAVLLLCEEEDDPPMWNLKGYTAIEGNFALCNVYFPDRADLDWAMGIWKSLRN